VVADEAEDSVKADHTAEPIEEATIAATEEVSIAVVAVVVRRDQPQPQRPSLRETAWKMFSRITNTRYRCCRDDFMFSLCGLRQRATCRQDGKRSRYIGGRHPITERNLCVNAQRARIVQPFGVQSRDDVQHWLRKVKQG
jgi:hypothetical protein